MSSCKGNARCFNRDEMSFGITACVAQGVETVIKDDSFASGKGTKTVTKKRGKK